MVRAEALHRTHDLRALITAQLPRTLQTRLSVAHIETDAYHLGGTVVLTDGKQRWHSRLDATTIDGVQVACVLPAWFIDHLCATA